jgi:selenide,water dikinase
VSFDLLKTVEYGGCSAKLPANLLDNILSDLRVIKNENLLVGIDTHDDAAVYKINEEQAIIFTTDFFPPVCSDPYTFGQIAAANALSDVYAMGGQVLMALNLIMFPSKDVPLTVLSEILKGGQDKVNEAGGLIVGGHTIDDSSPKYGLAVVGLIHPQHIITNAMAQPGDVLILTKPIGTTAIMAGYKLNLTDDKNHSIALNSMKQLNKKASEIMRKYNIQCATDITGFGLFGHLKKMAAASDVCLEMDAKNIPFIDGAIELIEMGCIPGAAFRNQNFVESEKKYLITNNISYEQKMLCYDAQTSGGMLICAPKDQSADMLIELREHYPMSSIIGNVNKK